MSQFLDQSTFFLITLYLSLSSCLQTITLRHLFERKSFAMNFLSLQHYSLSLPWRIHLDSIRAEGTF